ncbi:MAG: HAD hydrolase family protein, partial [Clostridiales bacterium]|nr:HAD hydrolase family protein [Clostridiales bacterium]
MGMRLLMQKMNVSKEEAAAFGDNFNDETMLDSVGYPFLMSSADPALRKSGYMLCEKELPVLKRIIGGRGTLLTE